MILVHVTVSHFRECVWLHVKHRFSSLWQVIVQDRRNQRSSSWWVCTCSGVLTHTHSTHTTRLAETKSLERSWMRAHTHTKQRQDNNEQLLTAGLVVRDAGLTQTIMQRDKILEFSSLAALTFFCMSSQTQLTALMKKLRSGASLKSENNNLNDFRCQRSDTKLHLENFLSLFSLFCTLWNYDSIYMITKYTEN